MSAMDTIPQSHRDLLDVPQTASLSTLSADGMPQVTAFWVLADGDVLKTSLQKSWQKYRNIVAHPKATVFLIDPTNPMRTLELRCDITISEDPNAEFLDQILGHYGIDPTAFPAPRDGRVVVTLTPQHVTTFG
jgi:PPOX class probable F420-dependent enzyme